MLLSDRFQLIIGPEAKSHMHTGRSTTWYGQTCMVALVFPALNLYIIGSSNPKRRDTVRRYQRYSTSPPAGLARSGIKCPGLLAVLYWSWPGPLKWTHFNRPSRHQHPGSRTFPFCAECGGDHDTKQQILPLHTSGLLRSQVPVMICKRTEGIWQIPKTGR